MTNEQYLDDLFQKEQCGYEKTSGFRTFMLDAMAAIGERPRAGDVASMHMAYKAGRESHISIGDKVRIVSANGSTTIAALADDGGWGVRRGDTGTVTAVVDAEVVAICTLHTSFPMDSVTHWYVDLCDLEKVKP